MDAIIKLAYLLAASLFIIGLKRLGSPATARTGNQISALGMLIAVIATLMLKEILDPALMIAGVAIGSLIGVVMARKVEMTSMPEMVAALNGFGGAASAFVAAGEISRVLAEQGGMLATEDAITISLSMFIGTLTLTGSFIALGKLSGFLKGGAVTFPGIRILTLLLLGLLLGGVGHMIWATAPLVPEMFSSALIEGMIAIAFASFFLGIITVIPIGGADMPVVVALLNSYSGLAASATGFVLGNDALIVSGALVGASGLILTQIMCEAMNRSLLNVLIGGFGETAGAGGGDDFEGKSFTEIKADDTAILLAYAQSVVIVPGYGMAVAQAQHQVRELSDLLKAKDVTVKFAIHPVAGRMPGHMNVLLAEANVSYDLLIDMDDINPEFETTDVVLVIGANDVVNPAARHNESSPIYGMPILNVDYASNVIVLKRSMRPGYAGVQNELFFNSKTSMLFGDAKDSISGVIEELKGL